MYNKNWESCSFMRVRHVPMHGTLAILATVHFMQWCRLPRLSRAHQIHTKKEMTYMLRMLGIDL